MNFGCLNRCLTALVSLPLNLPVWTLVLPRFQNWGQPNTAAPFSLVKKVLTRRDLQSLLTEFLFGPIQLTYWLVVSPTEQPGQLFLWMATSSRFKRGFKLSRYSIFFLGFVFESKPAQQDYLCFSGFRVQSDCLQVQKPLDRDFIAQNSSIILQISVFDQEHSLVQLRADGPGEDLVSFLCKMEWLQS